MDRLSNLSKEERTQLAIVAYRRAVEDFEKQLNPPAEKPSVRKVARQYRLVDTTLRRRIGGAQPNQVAQSKRQKLNPKQEEALARWILQMGAWGSRPRVNQIRFMATEFLRKNQSDDDLGINWVLKFLSRHKELRPMFSQSQNKESGLAYDEGRRTSWFQLYVEVIEQYGFHPEDVYSMEEKGFAMGAQGKLKVMCSEHEQRGNQEWVSPIDCESDHGEVLKSWFVLKGKVHQDVWYTSFEGGHTGE